MIARKLTDRVVQMVEDTGVELDEAIAWVLRRMPKGLKEHYEYTVNYLACAELNSIIWLTDVVD